ncbi:hypothetical protein CDAR_207121 [Caerostris darwini]|uniref:Transmembrane protein n=1 Tax=Caerostris darwini TaxID=1538125 RepID=A0AAV4SRQ8_9ARAC|nr:hypothetical protein CDAR_207121 [Caerostris darwini]
MTRRRVRFARENTPKWVLQGPNYPMSTKLASNGFVFLSGPRSIFCFPRSFVYLQSFSRFFLCQRRGHFRTDRMLFRSFAPASEITTISFFLLPPFPLFSCLGEI